MKTALVFFKGWSIWDLPFLELPKDRDLIAVDFREGLSIEKMNFLAQKLASFDQIYGIGFSLGVWNFHRFLSFYPDFQKFPWIAINGTAKVLDKKEGILPAVFALTLKNKSLETLQKFHQSIAYPTTHFDLSVWEDLEDFYQKDQVFENKTHFAIISEEDRIFLSENQKKIPSKYSFCLIEKTSLSF